MTTVRDAPSKDAAHPGEKIAVVDVRTLPTSGTDEKFQGTFLSLKVKSIDQVKPVEEKAADEAHKSQANTATVSKDAGEKEHKVAPKEKSPTISDQAKTSPATNR